MSDDHGWIQRVLGSVAMITMGQSPPSSTVSDSDDGVGLPFLQGNAEFGDIYPSPQQTCRLPLKTCHRDDALISVRAPVGATNKADQNYCIGRGLAAVTFVALDPSFGWHALLWAAPSLRSVAQGTTFEAVGTKALASLTLSMPTDEPEQQRIAEILDTADEAIRGTQSLIAKLRTMYQGLRQDLLRLGIGDEGELRDPIDTQLFADTGLGNLPRTWAVQPCHELMRTGRPVTYGIVQPGRFTPGGVPLIRGQDYINGWQPLASFFRVARHLHRQYARSTTGADDVLLTIVGATTGASAIVPSWIGEANITQTTARLSFDGRLVLPRFGRLILESEYGQRQVRHYVKGSAQPGLNLADVERFLLPVPPLSEQREIVTRLENASSRIIREIDYLKTIRSIKVGLTKDLLTGHKRVNPSGHAA